MSFYAVSLKWLKKPFGFSDTEKAVYIAKSCGIDYTVERFLKTSGAICGMSNAAYRRPDGVFVVPVTALKN